jgi:hypothetical protein
VWISWGLSNGVLYFTLGASGAGWSGSVGMGTENVLLRSACGDRSNQTGGRSRSSAAGFHRRIILKCHVECLSPPSSRLLRLFLLFCPLS